MAHFVGRVVLAPTLTRTVDQGKMSRMTESQQVLLRKNVFGDTGLMFGVNASAAEMRDVTSFRTWFQDISRHADLVFNLPGYPAPNYWEIFEGERACRVRPKQE